MTENEDTLIEDLINDNKPKGTKDWFFNYRIKIAGLKKQYNDKIGCSKLRYESCNYHYKRKGDEKIYCGLDFGMCQDQRNLNNEINSKEGTN